MGFSIHYRSANFVHPAQAFKIKQHAEHLNTEYIWLSCEPVRLNQHSDGHLQGVSKPNFCPDKTELDVAELNGVPDGTVLAVAEVLCILSREHQVDWDVGHNYEPEPIGQIRHGQADADLLGQLETFGTIGDLLDEMVGDDQPPTDVLACDSVDQLNDDGEEPRVLKFPGTQ